MKTVLKLLAKSVLILWWLTAAASATDVSIQKNIFGSGMTTLIISNEEMNDINESSKTLWRIWFIDKKKSAKNEAKEQKR